MNKTIIDRAVELLRERPELKYYEAIEMARGENYVKANNSRGTSSKRPPQGN